MGDILNDIAAYKRKEIESRLFKPTRRCVVHGRQDDQNAVSAPGARFGDLVGIIHEILAQHRQSCCRACLGQKFGPSLE